MTWARVGLWLVIPALFLLAFGLRALRAVLWALKDSLLEAIDDMRTLLKCDRQGWK